MQPLSWLGWRKLILIQIIGALYPNVYHILQNSLIHFSVYFCAFLVPIDLHCKISYNTHTHTHPLNGPLSGTTRVSRYQKGKTNLDFTGARDNEWQWHQLGHMQGCISLQTDNHASTPPLSFLQAGCPSCRPTNSVKALEAQNFIYWIKFQISKNDGCGEVALSSPQYIEKIGTFPYTTNKKYHMAYRFLSFLLTLNDLKGHSPVARLLNCSLTNICSYFCTVSADTIHCVVPRRPPSILSLAKLQLSKIHRHSSLA